MFDFVEESSFLYIFTDLLCILNIVDREYYYFVGKGNFFPSSSLRFIYLGVHSSFSTFFSHHFYASKMATLPRTSKSSVACQERDFNALTYENNEQLYDSELWCSFPEKRKTRLLQTIKSKMCKTMLKKVTTNFFSSTFLLLKKKTVKDLLLVR